MSHLAVGSTTSDIIGVVAARAAGATRVVKRTFARHFCRIWLIVYGGGLG